MDISEIFLKLARIIANYLPAEHLKYYVCGLPRRTLFSSATVGACPDSQAVHRSPPSDFLSVDGAPDSELACRTAGSAPLRRSHSGAAPVSQFPILTCMPDMV